MLSYSVNEKKKRGHENYVPVVSVRPKKLNGLQRLELMAGLGPSLGYDVIKTHGGVPIAILIKVEQEERVRTEFIVNLPI